MFTQAHSIIALFFFYHYLCSQNILTCNRYKTLLDIGLQNPITEIKQFVNPLIIIQTHVFFLLISLLSISIYSDRKSRNLNFSQRYNYILLFLSYLKDKNLEMMNNLDHNESTYKLLFNAHKIFAISGKNFSSQLYQSLIIK